MKPLSRLPAVSPQVNRVATTAVAGLAVGTTVAVAGIETGVAAWLAVAVGVAAGAGIFPTA